ncbi:MAG TPA: DUF1571 domain-containing protein [Planctomycetaceae bacterium]|nr:DUF1571 domain-containing protein [Planctomycetaceae bacterium]HQZ63869.1 DUF1571 domain-containing protein [Planctomycetaceae bacterium]
MTHVTGSSEFGSSRRRFAASLAAMGLTGFVGGFAWGDETAKPATEHPLTPALRHAKSCLERVSEMPSYECTFEKKEVVGKHVITQTMRMKVRHEPFSVYMYFEKPNAGREVIFVAGKNNNNLLVHEAGFASLIGTLELAPDGSQAMSENRYPITKAGIANLLEAIIQQWDAETKYGETEVKYFEDAKVGNMACRVIESTHPQPRKQFNFHITRLWIDEKSGLPVRVQQFGFPTKKNSKPPLLEDYTFSNIKAEVRLTDRDFDTKNPSYNY